MSATGDRKPVGAREAGREAGMAKSKEATMRRLFFIFILFAGALAACQRTSGTTPAQAGPGAVRNTAGGTGREPGPGATAAGVGASGQEEPPAALALEVRPLWPTVYTGGPLAIRAQIASPRARQDAYRELRALEDGTKLKAPPFQPPDLPEDWAAQVVFTVKQVQADGSTKPALEGLDWTTCLVPLSEDQTADPAGASALPREWNAGPDVAPLVEGAYLLQAAWKGPEGTLTASETRFTVKPAVTQDEKTEHARRLAKFEFGRGRYEEALAQATAVIDADPVFTPEIAETFMVAAASQAGLKNWQAAADTYKKLIAWLPAKSDLTESVKDMLKYVEEQDAAAAR